MRRRLALESFDPKTLWPIRVYASYLAAEAAGHDRGAIHQVLSGRRQYHHDMGWRKADAVSRLPDYVDLYHDLLLGAPTADCTDLGDLMAGFASWAGTFDQKRFLKVVEARFGVAWHAGKVVDGHVYDPPRRVVRGLVAAR